MSDILAYVQLLEERVNKFENLINTMTTTHRQLLEDNEQFRAKLDAAHKQQVKEALATIHASVKAEIAANRI